MAVKSNPLTMLKAIVWSYAPVAQLVEHWTLSMWRNGNSLPPTGRDAGSNPVVGSIIQESRVRVPAGAPNILLSRITAVQPALTRLVEVRVLWEQPYARLAQLVEQRTLNPWVAGSNPPTSTIFCMVVKAR